MPKLIIKKGNEEIDERTFTEDIITIGRAITNYIKLLDNKRVSRYHAALIRVKGKDEYFIRDLGSLSSTKVGGETVYRRLLEDGDTIEIEDYTLEYSKGGKPSDVFEFITGETKREFQESDEITTDHYGLLDSASVPEAFSPEKRWVLVDILRQIKVSSSFSEISENILDPILAALRLSKIAIIADEGGNLALYASRGIKMQRGEKIFVPPSLTSEVRREHCIHDDRDILIIPLGTKGKEGVNYFMYLEKEMSAGGLAEGDRYFSDCIAHSLYQKTLCYREAKQVALEDILDWPDQIIGNSRAMDKIREEARRVSSSDGDLLILGETGTGKDLLAGAIHENSRRKDRLFKVVYCDAIPRDLVESALFGHEKGAFTGADTRKNGLIEETDGGTIFLNEIGELPLSVQAKLRGFLDNKKFMRVGGTETIQADVRIIAATNRNLREDVREGKFREDLFYRVYKSVISLPPLRERKEDIPLLACFFLDTLARENSKNIKGISHEAMKAFWRYYDWPGNVRELRNCIERAVVGMPEGRTIMFSHDLPEVIKTKLRSEEAEDKSSRWSLLEELEKEEIEKKLESANWNIKKAAEILGISRPTVYSKMKKYNIQK